jgi:dihydrofolate synthase/folylpolyglutamate synthase
MSLTDLRRAGPPGERHHYRAQRMRALLRRLHDPHLAVPTIHIAGTNGKGSTAAMLAAILHAAGLRVGLFTSPHLHSVVERIRIGLAPITREQFAGLFASVWAAAQDTARDPALPGERGAVTTLEMLTAMAFQYFRETGAAYQIVEAFVGGRHDTTNVVQPVLSVITNISRDHIPALGTTLRDIAYAKAGIIKPGVAVVAAPQRPGVHAVLAREAAALGSPLEAVPRPSQPPHAATLEHAHQDLHWRGRHGEYQVALPLLGLAQRENAAVAITAAERLIDQGAPLGTGAIRRGLAAVNWPARLELVCRNPVPVLADGAHCPRAMDCLVADLRRLRTSRRIIAVVGGLRGHQTVPTLRRLHALTGSVVAVQSRHPRSLPAEELAAALTAGGIPAGAGTRSVGGTLRQLMAAADANDLVLATGSLSVAAEAREELLAAVEADRFPGS